MTVPMTRRGRIAYVLSDGVPRTTGEINERLVALDPRTYLRGTVSVLNVMERSGEVTRETRSEIPGNRSANHRVNYWRIAKVYS